MPCEGNVILVMTETKKKEMLSTVSLWEEKEQQIHLGFFISSKARFDIKESFNALQCINPLQGTWIFRPLINQECLLHPSPRLKKDCEFDFDHTKNVNHKRLILNNCYRLAELHHDLFAMFQVNFAIF
ncbi:hypothetical protein RCL_jg11693.t1 [Rhizophagus clarus]|uniref:Uncharacterized protein n=1 Tax=Rhizophagus clarus TaxID=94130 RepID=A0A8H3R3K1_9GLOM|nr:hypothetical protein RCL_jg11693.t1 [Rhizophagus clarus]